jgi:hypothetical protein
MTKRFVTIFLLLILAATMAISQTLPPPIYCGDYPPGFVGPVPPGCGYIDPISNAFWWWAGWTLGDLCQALLWCS